MGTLTSKLRLFKPATVDNVLVQDDLNANFDLLDEKVPELICTSGTRPTGTSLYAGRTIYETDTNRRYVYDGSAWQQGGYVANMVRRVARNIETSDSAAIGLTETDVSSIAFTRTSGKRYTIVFHVKYVTTVANDRFFWRIREDSKTGTIRQEIAVREADAGMGHMQTISCEYTAGASGSKTFVLTFMRHAGTGTCTRAADTHFYVDETY